MKVSIKSDLKKSQLKTLEKLFSSEISGSFVEISEKQAYPLMDLGLVELVKWCENWGLGIATFSAYRLTSIGFLKYCEWCSENDRKKTHDKNVYQHRIVK
jgi:hypothetical protein